MHREYDMIAFTWRLPAGIGLTGVLLIVLSPSFVPTRWIASGGYCLEPTSNSIRFAVVLAVGGQNPDRPAGAFSFKVHPHSKAAGVITIDQYSDGQFTVEGSDVALQHELDKNVLTSVLSDSGLLPQEISELASMLTAIKNGTSTDDAVSGLKYFQPEPLLLLDDRYLAWAGCLGYLLIAASCLLVGVQVILRNQREG